MIRQSQIPAGCVVWIGNNRRSHIFMEDNFIIHTGNYRSRGWRLMIIWSHHFQPPKFFPCKTKSNCWKNNWESNADWNLRAIIR